LGWGRLRIDTSAAVVTNVANRNIIIYHRFVIDICNHRRIHVVDGNIVIENSAVPVATLVAIAAVSIAVVNAAVEADVLAPIARVEDIDIAVPAPIWGSPEITRARR
jgi:hypothetical protein